MCRAPIDSLLAASAMKQTESERLCGSASLHNNPSQTYEFENGLTANTWVLKNKAKPQVCLEDLWR